MACSCSSSGCSSSIPAKSLLTRIEAIYAERLSVKTGWGKNEVLAAYKDSVNEVLMEIVEIEIEKEEYPK